MQTFYLLVILLAVWNLILTGFIVFFFVYFRRLSKGVDRGNLITLLDKVVKQEKYNSELVSDLSSRLNAFIHQSVSDLQKVAVLRFNPFDETGGDHSFSLALLDGEDSGVVITGLHARDRTRVYAKKIVKGKSEIELSKEESKVMHQAIKK